MVVRLLIVTAVNGRELIVVFIEFLKILSIAVVGWLLLIEEVRMGSHGFLAMATAFAPTTLYFAKNQIYQLILIIFINIS